MIENPPHPAKYSKAILSKIDQVCEMYEIMSLIDLFGGTGKIFDVCSPFIVSNEIEWEWLVQGHQGSPWHGTHCVQGDACHLPFKDGAFKAAATSCTYGNRMADSHKATEKCRVCNGTGTFDNQPCYKCKGIGQNTYKRMTYTHQLGRPLHFNNSGQMQWGEKYRLFHEYAWAEMTRVTREYFILNVSDHIRAGKVMPVCDLHVETLTRLGWLLIEEHQIDTPRMKMGQNYEARVDYEKLYIFRKLSDDDQVPHDLQAVPGS